MSLNLTILNNYNNNISCSLSLPFHPLVKPSINHRGNISISAFEITIIDNIIDLITGYDFISLARTCLALYIFINDKIKHLGLLLSNYNKIIGMKYINPSMFKVFPFVKGEKIDLLIYIASKTISESKSLLILCEDEEVINFWKQKLIEYLPNPYTVLSLEDYSANRFYKMTGSTSATSLDLLKVIKKKYNIIITKVLNKKSKFGKFLNEYGKIFSYRINLTTGADNGHLKNLKEIEGGSTHSSRIVYEESTFNEIPIILLNPKTFVEDVMQIQDKPIYENAVVIIAADLMDTMKRSHRKDIIFVSGEIDYEKSKSLPYRYNPVNLVVQYPENPNNIIRTMNLTNLKTIYIYDTALLLDANIFPYKTPKNIEWFDTVFNNNNSGTYEKGMNNKVYGY